jgi:hypothetical protein
VSLRLGIGLAFAGVALASLGWVLGAPGDSMQSSLNAGASARAESSGGDGGAAGPALALPAEAPASRAEQGAQLRVTGPGGETLGGVELQFTRLPSFEVQFQAAAATLQLDPDTVFPEGLLSTWALGYGARARYVLAGTTWRELMGSPVVLDELWLLPVVASAGRRHSLWVQEAMVREGRAKLEGLSIDWSALGQGELAGQVALAADEYLVDPGGLGRAQQRERADQHAGTAVVFTADAPELRLAGGRVRGDFDFAGHVAAGIPGETGSAMDVGPLIVEVKLEAVADGFGAQPNRAGPVSGHRDFGFGVNPALHRIGAGVDQHGFGADELLTSPHSSTPDTPGAFEQDAFLLCDRGELIEASDPGLAFHSEAFQQGAVEGAAGGVIDAQAADQDRAAVPFGGEQEGLLLFAACAVVHIARGDQHAGLILGRRQQAAAGHQVFEECVA